MFKLIPNGNNPDGPAKLEVDMEKLWKESFDASVKLMKNINEQKEKIIIQTLPTESLQKLQMSIDEELLRRRK